VDCLLPARFCSTVFWHPPQNSWTITAKSKNIPILQKGSVSVLYLQGTICKAVYMMHGMALSTYFIIMVHVPVYLFQEEPDTLSMSGAGVLIRPSAIFVVDVLFID